MGRAQGGHSCSVRSGEVQGTPSLASGSPGAGAVGASRACLQGPVARSADVSIVPRRLGLLPESSVEARGSAGNPEIAVSAQVYLEWSTPAA